VDSERQRSAPTELIGMKNTVLRTKRLFWKASLLALVVNAGFLLAQFQKLGRLTPHDYLRASESLATTLALLGGVALILSWLSKHRKDERP
jgi:hypothetical protein